MQRSIDSISQTEWPRMIHHGTSVGGERSSMVAIICDTSGNSLSMVDVQMIEQDGAELRIRHPWLVSPRENRLADV